MGGWWNNCGIQITKRHSFIQEYSGYNNTEIQRVQEYRVTLSTVAFTERQGYSWYRNTGIQWVQEHRDTVDSGIQGHNRY